MLDRHAALPQRRAGRLVGVALGGFALAAGPVFGAEPDSQDPQVKAALQQVISSQLKAFEKDDAKAAEEFAAPAIKERFPEPAQFLDMVKKDYGALIHPRSTQFVGVADSPHGPLQKVTIVAADGTVWSAIYSFEKVDGQWRITGCGLAKDETQQAI